MAGCPHHPRVAVRRCPGTRQFFFLVCILASFEGGQPPAQRPMIDNVLQQPGMRQVSPRLFRRLSLAAVLASLALLASGAWVRLSESGLGCSAWPACTHHRLVAPDRYHSLIEFSNRMLITAMAVIFLAVLAAAIARSPRRRDLLWLSTGLAIGYAAEAVLGGIAVLAKLAPALVAAHLILSLVILSCATALHWRSAIPDEAAGKRPEPVLPQPAMLGAYGLIPLFWASVVMGTIVTGSGPHSGKPGTPRFHLSLGGMVQIHAAIGLLSYGLALGLLAAVLAQHCPPPVQRRALAVVVLLTLQGALGYSVWFSAFSVIPSELHIAGAGFVLVAIERFNLGLLAHCGRPGSAGLAEAPPAPSGYEVPAVLETAEPSSAANAFLAFTSSLTETRSCGV